ncbi:transferase [Legionella sainthelensi]|uniref:Transferase n=1 Tax=Legionella sainthelensi TaxID=28087 RepID=A0A0W0YRW2_9GAMM|nr:gamma carbonic anhydrase family protein [Legionella sainthelensi]KTD59617.1 transferase [Legionella sainthelensi]VEH30097.1 transferase [Legionella sainthelensi]
MNDAVRSFQGKAPSLGQRIYIDPKSLVIGDVSLGDDVSIWPMAVVRGDVNSIKVGNACNIQDGSVLHVTHEGPYTAEGQPLILGQGITIGHHAALHGCVIDDFCLVGMGAIILDAVHIQHHVMVAAGSLVTPGSILKSGHLYLGSPAKAVRKLTAQELDHLEYSAQHYVRLKDKYLD